MLARFTQSQKYLRHRKYYNFVRIHATLRTTPACTLKVTERLWEIGHIVGVLEAFETRGTAA